MDLNNYCISKSSTVYEALEIISMNNERCVFVMNEENRMVGVLSQGDILRNLIKGMNLYAPIDSIYNRSFRYLKDKNLEKAFGIFKKELLLLLPVIDEEFHLIDIIKIADIYDYLEGRNA